jgi:anti-sigma regulatory factor (Ser/Thr protein kinase)
MPIAHQASVKGLELAKKELHQARCSVREALSTSNKTRTARLAIGSDLECLAPVRAFVEAFVAPAAPDSVHLVVQGVDEVLTNIIEHGYSMESDRPIEVELVLESSRVVVYLRDEAPEFDSSGAAPVDVEEYSKTGTVRGLGLFMVNRMMDQVLHRRRPGGGNETILIKAFKE